MKSRPDHHVAEIVRPGKSWSYYCDAERSPFVGASQIYRAGNIQRVVSGTCPGHCSPDLGRAGATWMFQLDQARIGWFRNMGERLVRTVGDSCKGRRKTRRCLDRKAAEILVSVQPGDFKREGSVQASSWIRGVSFKARPKWSLRCWAGSTIRARSKGEILRRDLRPDTRIPRTERSADWIGPALGRCCEQPSFGPEKVHVERG